LESINLDILTGCETWTYYPSMYSSEFLPDEYEVIRWERNLTTMMGTSKPQSHEKRSYQTEVHTSLLRLKSLVSR